MLWSGIHTRTACVLHSFKRIALCKYSVKVCFTKTFTFSFKINICPKGSALSQKVLPHPNSVGSGQCNYSPSAQSTVLRCGSWAEDLFQPSGVSLWLLGMALQNQQIVLCSFCGTDNVPALLLLRCSCSVIKNRLFELIQLPGLFHVHFRVAVYTWQLLCTCSCHRFSFVCWCPEQHREGTHPKITISVTTKQMRMCWYRENVAACSFLKSPLF